MLLKTRRYLSTSIRPLSSKISGKATAEATNHFITQSNLPFFHLFHKSKLSINPVICGPAIQFKKEDDADYIQSLATYLITEHRINCFVVYQHREKEPYFIPNLLEIVKQANIDREELVLIADLGVFKSINEVEERIKIAKDYTNLDTFDFTTIEVNDIMVNHRPATLDAIYLKLEQLCRQGDCQRYGIHMQFAPYNLHSPILEADRILR
jgi:hypothetical protein